MQGYMRKWKKALIVVYHMIMVQHRESIRQIFEIDLAIVDCSLILFSILARFSQLLVNYDCRKFVSNTWQVIVVFC